jgi:hypothetical protein
MAAFDVFLSYSSTDAQWVQQLKDALVSLGLRVWHDADQIRPGDLFAQALEEGIASSNCVALVISPASLHSGWVKEEYYRALSLAQGQQLRLIPVMLRNAELPGFLRSRQWVDFRDDAMFALNLQRLYWGITGERTRDVDLRTPVPPAARRWMPILAAGLLTLLTGLSFRIWYQEARLRTSEYLVVFIGWLLLIGTTGWLWRAFRKRRTI